MSRQKEIVLLTDAMVQEFGTENSDSWRLITSGIPFILKGMDVTGYHGLYEKN